MNITRTHVAAGVAAAFVGTIALVGPALTSGGGQVAVSSEAAQRERQCKVLHDRNASHLENYLGEMTNFAKTMQGFYAGEIKATPASIKTYTTNLRARMAGHRDKSVKALRRANAISCSQSWMGEMRADVTYYEGKVNTLVALTQDPIALQQTTI